MCLPLYTSNTAPPRDVWRRIWGCIFSRVQRQLREDQRICLLCFFSPLWVPHWFPLLPKPHQPQWRLKEVCPPKPAFGFPQR